MGLMGAGRPRPPVAVIRANLDGNIIAWPTEAERLFGWTTAEVDGRSLTLLMPSRFRARHEAGLNQVRQTDQSTLVGQELTMVGLHKDGTEFPVVLSVRLVRRGGRVVEVVGEVRRYQPAGP